MNAAAGARLLPLPLRQVALAHPASRRRRIVWLASYPRSGNTWVRLLLANVLSNEDVSINRMPRVLPGTLATSRRQFDDLAGIESCLWTDDEAEALRPNVYRYSTGQAAGDRTPLLFCKAHDALHDTSAGEPLFPEDATVGAIYILRNPLDVAVSHAINDGKHGFSDTIRAMNTRDYAVRGTARFLRERRLDWSGHVESWMAAPFPVLPVRYEDLLADTLGTLARMVRFLRLDGAAAPPRLHRAVRATAFPRLREQERREGFIERSPLAKEFFRSGKAGDWRRHLTAAQVREVMCAHGRVMAAAGYSD